MKAGIEIEFASPVTIVELLAKARKRVKSVECRRDFTHSAFASSAAPFDWTKYSYIGTDGSIKCRRGHFGLEYKSRVFDLCEGVPADVFEMLDFLAAAGCYVTKTCGIHIHVSDNAAIFSDSRLERAKLVLSKYKPDPKRAQWCDTDNGKYRRLLVISRNHVEVRVFNSSLQRRAVKNYVRITSLALPPVTVEDSAGPVENVAMPRNDGELHSRAADRLVETDGRAVEITLDSGLVARYWVPSATTTTWYAVDYDATNSELSVLQDDTGILH